MLHLSLKRQSDFARFEVIDLCAAPAGKTAQFATAGTGVAAVGDRGGLACFERSLDGFWR